jgi:itaconate CoA-transferase
MESSNPFASHYKDKLCDADEAVAPVGDNSLLSYGAMLAEPPAVLWALATRLRTGDLKKLRIFAGPAAQPSIDSVLALDLADCVERESFFIGASDRSRVYVGLNYLVPAHFHQVPRLIEEHMQVDVAATVVSPMDRAGFFSFGVANDFISTAMRCAKRVIVEVNEFMPRVHGNSRLHISQVTNVVENHSTLPDFPAAVPEPVDELIGRTISEMVPDGATLQLGIGNVPAAVASYLKDHKHLGIHTEFFSQVMVDLIQAGVVTGERKTLHPRQHVFTIAAGAQPLLDFLHDNPSVESHPVSYTNHPTVIARHDNMISINAAIEVDLLGQANAEFMDGHQFSGSGGQLDFVRGAYDSKGGKSILAFHSTARKGTVSRIVPRFEPGTMITTPRNDTHYLVTEYGSANLKGKSTRDRALAIIGLAHPDFRDQLLRAAEDMYIV